MVGVTAPPDLRLRELREARGWSLRALAQRSGVSAAMLSEIERGAKSPTVRLAYQIAQALDCSISALLEGRAGPTAGPADGPATAPPADAPLDSGRDPQGPPTDDAARPRRAAVLEEPGGRLRRESHGSPLLHGRLEVVVYTLAPGASSGPLAPNRPGTVEQVVTLDGEVELLLDGRPSRLEPGASVAHGVHTTEYRNPSDAPARFLVLVDTTRC